MNSDYALAINLPSSVVTPATPNVELTIAVFKVVLSLAVNYPLSVVSPVTSNVVLIVADSKVVSLAFNTSSVVSLPTTFNVLFTVIGPSKLDDYFTFNYSPLTTTFFSNVTFFLNSDYALTVNLPLSVVYPETTIESILDYPQTVKSPFI